MWIHVCESALIETCPFSSVSVLRPGNVLYVVLFGWWIALIYLLLAGLMAVTIVGKTYSKFVFKPRCSQRAELYNVCRVSIHVVIFVLVVVVIMDASPRTPTHARGGLDPDKRSCCFCRLQLLTLSGVAGAPASKAQARSLFLRRSRTKESAKPLPLVHTELVKRNGTSQHEKWKQLLPRGVFTHQAEAEAEANNGGDVHFLHCNASRILCGWGVRPTPPPPTNKCQQSKGTGSLVKVISMMRHEQQSFFWVYEAIPSFQRFCNRGIGIHNLFILGYLQ